MLEQLMSNEPSVRLGVFLSVFTVVGIWELLNPRRTLTASKPVRWINNLGLIALNGMILRIGFPFLAIETAIISQENGWGLANIYEIPFSLSIVIGVLALDLAIYIQHVIFHKYPILWKLHRMHHIDPDLDVTSGTRFHPIEIALSMLIKMGLIVILGPPAVAVLIFELLLNGSAMFNHGNIFIPSGIDRILRGIIVTPDMHRVHHSVIRKETDSNYGFFLSLWDRIFKTYRKEPEAGQLGMKIGIGEFEDGKFLKLHWLLSVPFLKGNT